jgi:hypothetical protein
MGDHLIAKPLSTHRTAHTYNKGRQASMPLVGFEPTNPTLERRKTVHALDRVTTLIGK